MFKDSEIKEKRRPPSFWLKVVVVVAIALIVINAFRVKPPPEKVANSDPPVENTKGVLVDGPVAIEPDGFVSHRMSFPYRSTVKGMFRVRERGPRVTAMILDEENLNKWRQGSEYAAATSTGRVPAGRISRVLEAGTYFLVFDNRDGNKPLVVDASFTVE